MNRVCTREKRLIASVQEEFLARKSFKMRISLI